MEVEEAIVEVTLTDDDGSFGWDVPPEQVG
jgi:hypothetical protein